MLNVKQAGIKYHFWVFGMSRRGIETVFPGSLAKTQLVRPMDLFQTIQFSLIIQFSSIWPIDRTLYGATTPGQILYYYLPIAGGRIIGFIPFPRVLVLYEMQSISSRIWTRSAVSISYDDNHYTTRTSEGFG